jgi:hypothetical protein
MLLLLAPLSGEAEMPALCIKVHFQGDSIPAGYPGPAGTDIGAYLLPLLAARGDGNTYSITNTASPNRTLLQINANYAAYVGAGYDPTADRNILVLWAGGNDIFWAAGQQASAIAAFESIVAEARATGYDEVCVLNLIQRGFNNSGSLETWRTEASAINAAFAARAELDDDVTLIDIKSLFAAYDWAVDPWSTPAASVRPEYADWAHPTPASHSAEAEFLAPFIRATSGPVFYLGLRTIFGNHRIDLVPAEEGDELLGPVMPTLWGDLKPVEVEVVGPLPLRVILRKAPDGEFYQLSDLET